MIESISVSCMIFVRSLYRQLVNSCNQLFLQVFYTFIQTGCLPKIFHIFTGILYFHTDRVSQRLFIFYTQLIVSYAIHTGCPSKNELLKSHSEL